MVIGIVAWSKQNFSQGWNLACKNQENCDSTHYCGDRQILVEYANYATPYTVN